VNVLRGESAIASEEFLRSAHRIQRPHSGVRGLLLRTNDSCRERTSIELGEVDAAFCEGRRHLCPETRFKAKSDAANA
jgi:hypothetical protein